MSDLNTITPEKLMRRIGLPDSPLVVDVRIPEDLTAAPFAIPTSIRWDFQDVGGLIERAADRDCIVVCHKGLKLSQGVAALLRNTGTRAEVLKGGHVAWTEAALSCLSRQAMSWTSLTGLMQSHLISKVFILLTVVPAAHSTR